MASAALSSMALPPYQNQHSVSSPNMKPWKFTWQPISRTFFTTNFLKICVHEIYAWLDKNNANERKEGQTDEQFYYKTRKRALGEFKQKIWGITPEQLKDHQCLG